MTVSPAVDFAKVALACNYAAAFPILRKITTNYPNTSWANQAYFYIGMSHYRMGNWNKAIDSLSLVGTEVDAAEGDDLGRIEIGYATSQDGYFWTRSPARISSKFNFTNCP